jgi:tetratricopeptide (TPR) repeat protein
VMAPREAMFKTKAAATKALDLDETIAEAHTSLGFLSYIFDWDWAVAEKHYKRAIELNPNYATAHHWYSLYLTAMLRMNEAIVEAKTAQELDPFSLIINTDLGLVFYRARQYDRAIEQLKKTLEMEPNFAAARWNLGRAFLQKQMHPEAIAELRRAAELSGRNPVYLAALGHALAVSGRRQEAVRILDDLKGLSKRRYVLPSLIAIIYIGLEDGDQAFAWLEKAYQERSDFMIVLKVEPVLDGLRSDPRFADLLQRVGLTQ